MHLHFEGLDLAGKSTVCRRFRAQANGEWEIRHNALTPDNSLCAAADVLRRGGASAETVGWAYYSALLLDVERFTPPSGNVIQDSTILLRSLAFHKVRGALELVDRLESALAAHPGFDRSFVCVANHEVRLRRLAVRRPENLSPEDFLVRDDPRTFFEMERILIHYAQLRFNAEVIDTSGLEEQERLAVVFDRLPGLERGQRPEPGASP